VENKEIRILVIMMTWDSSFEERLFPLIDGLKEKGYDVTFCALMESMKQQNEIELPGLPEERAILDGFSKRGLKSVRSLSELRRYVLKANLVIGGVGKGLHKAVEVISAADVPYVVVNDLGHYLPVCYKHDLFFIGGELLKKNYITISGVAENKVVVAGDFRFDKVILPLSTEEKERFYKKYNLSSQKPFVVFCTGATQRIDPYTAKLYKGIVNSVMQNNFNIIIRPHPNEYAGHKKDVSYLKEVSYKALYPNAAVLSPGDWLSAMKLCACMISVESACCFEASVFNKHVVVVNFHEWFLKGEESRQEGIFPKKRFDGFGLKGCLDHNRAAEMHESGLLRQMAGPYGRRGLLWPGYSWLGADCYLEELPKVLNSPDLKNVDQSLREKHIERFWFKLDGKATERIVDSITDFINDPRHHERMFRPEVFRIVGGGVNLPKKFMRRILKKKNEPTIAKYNG